MKDLKCLFSGCASFESLPDISKWNTNNVLNMIYLFHNFKSLISLPHLSKWNLDKVENISLYIFKVNTKFIIMEFK